MKTACPRCEVAERIAHSAWPLTRTPRKPTGGMRTGDMIEVGMRDWFALVRLARYLVGDEERKGET